MDLKKYIGLPFIDRDEDRCYGFARRLLREEFDTLVPSFDQLNLNCDQYVRVDRGDLIPGDVLVFWHEGTESHVGVYVGNGKVLHSTRHVGSVLEDLNSFGLRNKLSYAVRVKNPKFHISAQVRPFTPDTIEADFSVGLSIADVVSRLYGDRAPSVVILWLNGHRVATECWSRVFPKKGTHVDAVLYPSDMFSNSDSLRQMLDILAMFGSAQLAQKNFFLGSAMAIFSVWLIQTLIPPAPQKVEQTGYSLNGTSNSLSPWKPFPILFGKMRVVPPLGAQPYTEVVGNDRYLRILLIVGFGPLRLSDVRIGNESVMDELGNPAFPGLVEMELRGGWEYESPISLVTQDVEQDDYTDDLTFVAGWVTKQTGEDADEISLDVTFPSGLCRDNGGDEVQGWSVNVQIQYRLADRGDGAWLDLDEYTALALATEAAAFTVADVTASMEVLREALEAQVTALDALDPEDRTITAETQADLIYRITTLTSILTLMNNRGDGSLTAEILNMTSLLYELDGGLLGHIEEMTPEDFADLTIEALAITDLISKVIDAIQILAEVNNYQAQGYGPELSTFPWWAQWLIRRRGLASQFGDPPVEAFRITGASKLPLTRSFRWKVAKGKYDVRVKRVSEDTDPEETSGVSDLAQLTAIRTVYYRKPINTDVMPPLAMIAMRIKASDSFNGSLDTISVMAESYYYEPILGGDETTYTWTETISRNPALAYIWTLIAPFNKYRLHSLGSLPTTNAASRFDLVSLDLFKQQCAGEEFNVDGEDPLVGRSFDMYITDEITIDNLLRTIAACGRAAHSVVVDKYGVALDLEYDAETQCFSPENSWGFQFEKSYIPQPDALRISYLDPNSDYQKNEKIVYNDGFDESTAQSFEVIDMPGCTDHRQAWADGRYFLAVGKLRSRSFSLQTMLAWIKCKKGSLVRINHDVTLWGSGWGAIRSYSYNGGTNKTTVIVSNPLPMLAAETYGLRVLHQDSFSQEKTLISPVSDGEYTSVQFTGQFDLSPNSVPVNVNDMVMFGKTGQVSHEVIVTSITPGVDGQATMTFVDYAPGVHRDPNDPIPPFIPDITRPPVINSNRIQKPVIALDDEDEQIIYTDERALLRMPDGSLKAQVYIKLNLQPVNSSATRPSILETWVRRLADVETDEVNLYSWVRIATVSADTEDVYIQQVEERHSYDIRLRYVDPAGLTSDWTLLSSVFVFGKTLPPPDVTTLMLDGQKVLRWSYLAPPLDFSHFIIKSWFGDVPDSDWGIPTTIFGIPLGALTHVSTSANQIIIESSTPGIRTFMVKAVDMQGNESLNPARLVADIAPLELENVLETMDYRVEGWPGYEGFAEVDDGDLVALHANDQLMWVGTDPLWTDDEEDPLFWGSSWSQLIYFVAFVPLSGTQGSRLFVEIETQNLNYILMYTENPSPAGLGDFVPFPGSVITDETKTYIFYFFHSDPTPIIGLRPKLIQFKVLQDVPDIIERFEDVVITDASAGVRLPIQRTYKKIVTVHGFVLQDDAGDAVTIKTIDKGFPSNVLPEEGPLIKAFDAAGDPTTASFDVTVGGY